MLHITLPFTSHSNKLYFIFLFKVYFQQYVGQPFIFRQGANVGFHEVKKQSLKLIFTKIEIYCHVKTTYFVNILFQAVGDAIALSVVTPKHLQCVLGLDLKQDPSICGDGAPKNGSVKTTESDINYLYSKALNIVRILIFEKN